MNKEEIRRKIRAQKSLLNEVEKMTAADQLFERLEKLAAFIMSDHILVYHSLPDELSTRRFIDKWAGRKHFYLPRVNGVNLDILPYDKSRLHLGAFQIEEPDGDSTAPLEQMELIIVPAVAYDQSGRRVGRGKGFYDRLLADTNATKIGIGYDFQLVDEIPSDTHDVDMDIIVTNNRCIVVKSTRH